LSFGGIARFRFHKGKAEEFKRLSAQAMEIVRTKDTGTRCNTTSTSTTISPSGPRAVQGLRDGQRAASNLGDLFGAVLDTVTVVHGELIGEPSAELREKLAGGEVPVFFTPFLSM
jgi:hypothetical protein